MIEETNRADADELQDSLTSNEGRNEEKATKGNFHATSFKR